jgi:hypothetical protein
VTQKIPTAKPTSFARIKRERDSLFANVQMTPFDSTMMEHADVSFAFITYLFAVFMACNATSNCDTHALCANKFDAFQCQCRPGYLDISPDPERNPGRVCKERERFSFTEIFLFTFVQ